MAATLTVSALLAACSQADTDIASPQSASASASGELSPMLLAPEAPASRAASPLGDLCTDFGVWAWKTNPDNTLSLVLGRAVASDPGTEYRTCLVDNAWTYILSDASATQYLRYWDQSATQYRFSAYAPYTGAAGTPLNLTHAISATPDGVTIPDIAGNIPVADGTDWLVASWQRDMLPTPADTDRISSSQHTPAAFNDAVPLAFHHVMAMTEFRIFYDGVGDLRLGSIDITLDAANAIATSGSYSAGTWILDHDTTATTLLRSTATVLLTGTDKEHCVSLVNLLQLPQDVAGRTIHVNAVGTDSYVRTGSFTITEGWQGEKVYVYYLCLTDHDIILMDFDVAPWIHGVDIEVSEPVVNW